MKNSFLFPFLFSSTGANDGNGNLDWLKLKYQLDLLSGKESNKDSEDLTKLAMLVPIAKNMINSTAKKIESLSEDKKNTLIASSILRAVADQLLADDPEDEITRALRDVCDEYISQFVFVAAPYDIQKRIKTATRRNEEEVSSEQVGAELVASRKVGRDIVKAIPVEGEVEKEEGGKEEKRAVKSASPKTETTATKTKTKKNVPMSSPF